MKRTLWLLTALVAGTLFLAACGSTLDAANTAPELEITAVITPDTSYAPGDPDYDQMGDPLWWQANGPDAPYDFCFQVRPNDEITGPSTENFSVYPVPGHTWELFVIKLDETYYTFQHPGQTDILDPIPDGPDGWDQVIGCKNLNEEGGCALTQGYWKTHSMYGPAPYDPTWAQVGEDSPFYLSGQTWYDVMWTAPRGNGYYILAVQFIAAYLNDLNGADVSSIETELTQAMALFEAHTPVDVAGSRDLQGQFKALAETLDDYNNGLIGPGHCD